MNTARIPLTQGYEAIIDAADLPLVECYKWHAVKSENGMYAVSNGIKMHRLLLGFPESHIDHRDGDTLNNTRNNLRPATVSQNQMNRRPNVRAKSRFKGVSQHKRSGKWQAEIQRDGKKRYLGSFPTEEQAAQAYNEAALNLFGEFARLNEVQRPGGVVSVYRERAQNP